MKHKILHSILGASIFSLGVFVGIRYDQYQDKTADDEYIDKEVKEKTEEYTKGLKWCGQRMRQEGDLLRAEIDRLKQQLQNKDKL